MSMLNVATLSFSSRSRRIAQGVTLLRMRLQVFLKALSLAFGDVELVRPDARVVFGNRLLPLLELRESVERRPRFAPAGVLIDIKWEEHIRGRRHKQLVVLREQLQAEAQQVRQKRAEYRA